MLIKALFNNFVIRSKMVIFVAFDYIGLIFGILFSHWLLEAPKNLGIIPQEPFWLWVLFLSFTLFLQFAVYYIAQHYIIPTRNRRVIQQTSLSLAFCLVVIALLLAVFSYLTKFTLGRDVLGLGILISWCFSMILRLVLVQIFSPKYLGLLKPQICVLLGQSALTKEVLSNPALSSKFTFCKLPPEAQSSNLVLEEFVKDNFVEIILIDSSFGSLKEESGNLSLPNDFLQTLIKLKFQGIKIIDTGSFLEKTLLKLPLLHLNNAWFLNTQIFSEVSNLVFLRMKRIIDIFGVLVTLPISVPLVLLCWVFIKITSPGPGLYSQKRVGLNGRLFDVYKLRTMIIDSEKEGVQWTSKNDPRITPVGKLLRKTRLDELPQLYNILIGDMSIIGPRPERPEFTENLKLEIPYYDLRHTIRPGLSGWAQINEPLASPSDSLQKLEYDLFYIRHISFWLEVDIILKTIRIVLMRQGR